MSERDQAGHGKELNPDAVEFQKWWEHDSGWGGEPLAEYHLAKAAWNTGQAQLRARVAELQEGYREAIEDIDGWGCYASEYFQEKHDLAGTIAKHRKLLESPTVQEAKE